MTVSAAAEPPPASEPAAATPGAIPNAECRMPNADDSQCRTRHYSSIRRFLETAILFVTVVIVLRAIAMEPFGVPTGSMAPTLAGNHKECTCPRCGYPIVVGSSVGANNDFRASQRAYSSAWCPNCYCNHLDLDKVPETTGDRLLVDKNIFEMRRPRRWEVAVFRCPDDVTKPYVKRVVGLPGEKVQIQDGDVYINGELARKTLEECRALRIPVFDEDYSPEGDGWKMRWRSGSPALNAALQEPGALFQARELHWDQNHRDEYAWLVYRHWLLDEKKEDAVRDVFGYNGGATRSELNFVHDFLIEFSLEVQRGHGIFAIGLRDGRDDIQAEIPCGIESEQGRTLHIEKVDGGSLADVPFILHEGKTYRIEMAFVDRRISLAVDGREVIAPLDLPAVRERKPVSRPVWLGAKNVSVTVRSFRIFRDMHYTPTGRNAIYEAWPLGPNEYFMLGDNSANSEDSRYWSTPGVPASYLLGRPLLLHQPSHWTSIRPGWDIQSVDWDRVRWIR
ncbi:MAG TPA: signal peptidase I [Gemmataceae bacterium]|nr:signal peptidase I [Gemmataceae bacterium]